MTENKHILATYRHKAEAAVTALQRNRFDARLIENCDELQKALRELMPAGSKVCTGGSVTLIETGVDKLLRDEYDFYYRGRLNEKGEPIDVLHAALCDCPWYLSSANAITLNGELYFMDGNSNRTAAILYGPDNVVIVAGANKIVRDLDEARMRLHSIAAPANVDRLKRDTGCRKTGYCVDCRSSERICCNEVICRFSRAPERTKVFLLPDSFGY